MAIRKPTKRPTSKRVRVKPADPTRVSLTLDLVEIGKRVPKRQHDKLPNDLAGRFDDYFDLTSSVRVEHRKTET